MQVYTSGIFSKGLNFRTGVLTNRRIDGGGREFVSPQNHTLSISLQIDLTIMKPNIVALKNIHCMDIQVDWKFNFSLPLFPP